MTLSEKISKRILLVLFSAMLISGVSCIIQAYFSFKREILMSARNSLDIFQAIHIQTMLNRGTVKDSDQAIATLNGTLTQLGANKDRYAVWALMAPTVISFQKEQTVMKKWNCRGRILTAR